jgi:hypothetical protein
MISALFPAFLAAGIAFAAVPLALHLITRRPPQRKPLPTARFLTEDARTLLRVQRVPTDLPLLALRVMFAVALGAAFAGLVWTPDRSGHAHVVLLDGGADSLGDWDAARQIAREATTAEASGDGQVSPVVLVYGLDNGARMVDASQLEGMERGSAPADAEDGLRALRSGVLTDTRYDRVDVTWVVRPRWQMWSTGVGVLRSALWPGSTAIRAVPAVEADGLAVGTAAGSTAAGSTEAGSNLLPPRSATIVDPVEDDPLARALEALAVPLVPEGAPTGGWIFADAPDPDLLDDLVTAVREGGATVVLSGSLSADVPDVPWAVAPMEAGPRGGVVVAPGFGVGSDVAPLGGAPRAGSSTVAVFQNATPAAAARSIGSGCIVYLAASIRDPDLVADPDYPELVHKLGSACDKVAVIDGPLDEGALQLLEQPNLPATVDVADLAAEAGYPLGRWMALLALFLLIGEVVMTRRRAT